MGKSTLKTEAGTDFFSVKYQKALHAAMDGFLLIDRDGWIQEVNEAFCTMSGYSESEVLELHFLDVNALLHREQLEQLLVLLTKKRGDRFYSKVIRRDGRILDVELSIQLVDFESGIVIVFMRDNTQRLWAERSLRESDRRHFNLFATMRHGVVFQNRNGEIISANPAEQRLQEQQKVLEDILEGVLAGYWDWNLKENTEYLSLRFKKMFAYEDHELLNTPFHSSLESLSAFAGISLAFMILQRRRSSRKVVSGQLVANGLLGMGILDVFHAWVSPSGTFVWFHSAAMLWGGLMMVLAWIPKLTVYVDIHRSAVLYFTIGVTTGVRFLCLLAPGSMPPMLMQGDFTLVSC